MPRWYAARLCSGKPETITQQVSALVRGHHLGRVVPLVRFEKRPRKGGFYTFLALESETPGVLPAELQPLREHPIIRSLMHDDASGKVQVFSLDDIGKMVTGEVLVEDYTRRLSFALPDAPSFVDPFPAGEADDGPAVDDLLVRTQHYDRLIEWMSAVGNGSLTLFQRACQAIGLAAEAAEPGRVLRRLRLLGHIESSADGTRWSVAPTVLARVVGMDGSPAHMLCGARDQSLLTSLRQYAAVDIKPQPRGDAPARIEITAMDAAQATVAGEPERLERAHVDDAAARLAQALPPLDQWKDVLGRMPNIKPELYEVRRFEGDGFVDAPLDGSGFYELWQPDGRGHRTGRPAYRLFYDAPRDRWLSGDWYGLRFLARVEDGGACPVHFDLLSGRLALPWAWRPPELYERALVLCSGRLPEHRDGWLLYDDVTQPVLGALAAKLHFTLQEAAPYA